MSEKPLVSVCVITYNHAAYIRQTLDTILGQEINFPLQIVVADDCSTDSTRKIVLEYKEKHPEIFKLVLQEKNVGPGRNFVDLFRAATGKYIAYVEGDDYWSNPRKLQMQFDFLESNPDFSLCYHRAKLQWEYDSPEQDHIDPETNNGDKAVSTIHDLLSIGWFIRSCSLFFRNIPLPQDFEKLYIGDYPLHVLVADTGKICFMDECMAVYRTHQKGRPETVLLSQEINRQRLNFRHHIEMLDYLNKHTSYKYDAEFQRSKGNNIYSHLTSLIKKDKKSFFKELVYVVRKYNPWFLSVQFFSKWRRSKYRSLFINL